MRSRHLVIFVENKIPGRVKSRLAAGIGPEKAMEVYDKLLSHTHQITRCLDCDKTVYFSEAIEQDGIWADGNFNLALQAGTDLGERMQNAFDARFADGAEKVCFIGSDTFEIKAETIQAAFKVLQEQDIVLGPVRNGGFYLLGMKELQPELFHPKNWNTEGMQDQILNDIHLLNLRYTLLPELHKIKLKEDWLAYLRSNALKE